MCEYVHTPEVPLRKSRECERGEQVGKASPRVAGATAGREGHARPEAAAGPPRRGSPAPRAPLKARLRGGGLPQEQLRPCPWPVANTSGELIENKFRSYETEMDGNCLGADTQ